MASRHHCLSQMSVSTMRSTCSRRSETTSVLGAGCILPIEAPRTRCASSVKTLSIAYADDDEQRVISRMATLCEQVLALVPFRPPPPHPTPKFHSFPLSLLRTTPLPLPLKQFSIVVPKRKVEVLIARTIHYR